MAWLERDNGLSAKEEREYRRRYDQTVKRLRDGPGGREAAQEFIDNEHAKFRAWLAAQ